MSPLRQQDAENERNLTVDFRQKHMDDAARHVAFLIDMSDSIHNIEVKERLRVLANRINDLKDTQVLFDSGERELDQLYDRYLPYLQTIILNYQKLEGSWNFEEIQRVRGMLMHSTEQLMDSIQEIKRILPQDEMSMASAEKKAIEAKKQLEEKYGKTN